ncbi:hypothetical protein EV702DRAFT_1169593 [Suillus placidus]|uniref:Uncharacterized protein n=1 Tax=Suillus placidus TaxID=48579 RepID=A0A9P6ZEW6_9AGAM|nr:hypothetical protein EV702DRAFT_1169593 [Suillus placidus]
MAYIKNSIHSVKARCLPLQIYTSITSPRTMRFSIVLAAVAALILSADTVSADEPAGCPFLCIRHSDCDACSDGPTCVSMSSLYLTK